MSDYHKIPVPFMGNFDFSHDPSRVIKNDILWLPSTQEIRSALRKQKKGLLWTISHAFGVVSSWHKIPIFSMGKLGLLLNTTFFGYRSTQKIWSALRKQKI